MMESMTTEHDRLTGLPEFGAFMEALEGEMAQAEKAGASVSMALVDIDWFARLNKEHGTAAGDGVLKALAEYLRERFGKRAVYGGKVGGGAKVCLAREEEMVTKTSHYTQGQLHGLSRLAKREGIGEAVLLREALDDLLRKYNA